MCRMLAAILLVSSTRAFAQSPGVAEDQKQLQGIWRVRDVVISSDMAAISLPTHQAFDGDKLFIVMHGEPSSDLRYRLDAAKDPKHIDLVRTVSQPQRPQELIVPCIYLLERDRLKVRIAQPNRRPVDFSTVRRGALDWVLILDRDASPAARIAVQDALAILAIRELGGKTFSEDAHLGPPRTLNIKLDESKGDTLLAKIALQLKNRSSVDGLFLCRSKVTDAGLASLEGINNIAHIDLEGTAVTDAGLEHLRNMTHLRLLVVTDTQVTEAGVARLKKSLPHLRVTHFSRAEINSQLAIINAGGAQYYDETGRLLEIRFGRKVNDFQLLGLQKHLEAWKTSLRSIDLTDCQITDRGLGALGALTSLEQLTLKGTDVTVAGVKSLKRTVPNLKVKH